ncbi:MAG: transposase [Alphaproteobacteria bacterium]|nr:transposase [Alphaproteobacteria bacterium]MDE2075385.1 transposase [Alphaproteobacteria bacterium]
MIEAVPERMEGAPRRVRREWSEAFKAQLVAETLAPGANISAIARRSGISPSQLFGWRRLAIRNDTVTPLEALEGPRLVEVEAVASSAIEIIVGGVVVRAGAEVSEEHLRRVIRVVRSA